MKHQNTLFGCFFSVCGVSPCLPPQASQKHAALETAGSQAFTPKLSVVFGGLCALEKHKRNYRLLGEVSGWVCFPEKSLLRSEIRSPSASPLWGILEDRGGKGGSNPWVSSIF